MGGDLDDAIAALWARQRGEMMNRVDAVEGAVAALLAESLTEEQRAEAERAAHKIAGAAGSFGFPDASAHGREIELALRAGVALGDAPRLSELVLRIRQDFEAEPGRPRESSGLIDIRDFSADVLLICAERSRADELRAELAARGLHAARAPDDPEVTLKVRPPIALVDLSAPLADAFMDAVRDDAVRVVGLSADTSLDTRVAFTQRGGQTLLSADLTAHDIADAVAATRERLREKRTRILVVDDDAALLELTTAILREHGMEVHALEDPGRFWQALETVVPDLVLLDFEMPGFSGPELCRALRADPRWGQLPVLFVTARADADAVRAVFAAGADDYMTKPVVAEELVQRIGNRLERVRLVRALADRDALTGVPNRRKAAEELERLERLAKRYSQPLTVAFFDLDNFKRINDEFGHETGDDVLRRFGHRLQREFRGEDVVGRWGGEEFVVGMYGSPGVAAVERLRRLLDEWKRERFDPPSGDAFGTSFTAGLAELPGTADSLDELLRAADEALYRGKAAGRSRVQAAGERADVDVEQVDIAVVEDDSALVELLTHSLSTLGWSVRVLDDGPTAVGALASEPPLMSARLVLLDWDLPGLDGLAVLRRLRERGVLARTKVVMLTARGGETEVLKALELGATDHVTKPFSVPVLLEKVRLLVGAR